jgi:hypothetical protein
MGKRLSGWLIVALGASSHAATRPDLLAPTGH